MERLTHAALAKFTNADASRVSEFRSVLDRLSAPERRRAIHALKDMGEEDVELNFADILISVLEDSDPVVRATAVDGLWEDDRPATLDRLIALSERDREVTVRAAAVTGIGRFAYRLALGDLSPRLGHRVRATLIAAAGPNSPSAIRRRAVEHLGYVNDEQSIDLILLAYRSREASLRAGAIRAMGRTCDRRWVETVLVECANADPEIRFEAAQAAGEIEDPRAVPLLIRLVRDDDREVCLAAIAALGAIGGADARDELVRVRNGKESVLAEAADIALQDLDVESDPIGIRLRDVRLN
ncbi:MAG: HEAT repeat domain-containing protein [Chloroflexi bacterium]|nr:HEAT repeat domain-containing protein [Chloroflexota bacterium]